jgi:ABC-type glycerol-3-phosphate transport system substrate-binding protein
LGFESPPLNPVEFKDQSCGAAASSISAATSADLTGGNVGGWIASIDPGTVMAWMMAFGEDGINDDADRYSFDTLETEETFTFLKNLFRSGCAWFPESPFPYDEFAARKGLFFSSNITDLSSQREAFEFFDSEDEWILIPYPGKGDVPVINHFGMAYAILKSTPEVQLASWLFIRWMTQPENQVPIIEAGGYFPSRASTLDLMSAYMRDHPRWATIQDLMPYSKLEPGFGSWMTARWVVADAAADLISPGTQNDYIPQLIKEMEALLSEIHEQNR